MSVYKRPGAETFSYDFEVGGARFSGDTGATAKREALRFQEIERAKARELARKGDLLRPNRNMTFGQGAALYMVQVGLFHVNRETTQTDLERLEGRLGKNRRLVDIGDADVAQLVTDRRNDLRQVGKPENRARKVGPATVNRSTTEPLRKVLTRARKVWKLPVQDIDWSQHMLKEPKERVREASSGEESLIAGELARGYEDALEFDFINGLRLMELTGLVWSRVDFFGRRFTVIGKGGKSRTIPMSERSFQILWAQRGHHEDAVFTFVAARTNQGKVKGQRYPLTRGGFQTATNRAIARAGVQNFRPHDVRHTAATRTLRKSNMKVVKELLGHENIATTDKYAHAMADDIRQALDDVAAPAPKRRKKA